jgi:hypothetical protein
MSYNITLLENSNLLCITSNLNLPKLWVTRPPSMLKIIERKSLGIAFKHVIICSNPYIYTAVVEEVYSRDCSPKLIMLRGWQRLLPNIWTY